MKTLHKQKGFTLVELAIVMTIIGLLIGGILKGQELVTNAKVAATIAQIRAYEAAVSTFRDKYDELPGDISNATTKLPSCPAACQAAAPAGGQGNGIIGNPTWASGWATQSTTGGNETVLFWTHLLLADMIAGVTTGGISATTFNWGGTHPAAKIGGGFVVGHSNGGSLPGSSSASPAGMVLGLLTTPTAVPSDVADVQVLTPARAAQLDRKMDDGRPFTGSVQAYGNSSATANNACFDNSSANNPYIEANGATSCGLFFRIQG